MYVTQTELGIYHSGTDPQGWGLYSLKLSQNLTKLQQTEMLNLLTY